MYEAMSFDSRLGLRAMNLTNDQEATVTPKNAAPAPDQLQSFDRAGLDPSAPSTRLSLRLDEVVIDCRDPCLLARFWSEALAYEVTECDDDLASIEDPTGSGPGVFFQRVPEVKSAKNRVHFDLSVGGQELEAAVVQLISLGARRVDAGGEDLRWWVVLADPEGNEFCVVG
jgi:hypothetical protein